MMPNQLSHAVQGQHVSHLNGEAATQFCEVLLCENASPLGPELLILRESGNLHFQVKFTDFCMLTKNIQI